MLLQNNRETILIVIQQEMDFESAFSRFLFIEEGTLHFALSTVNH